jgi:16S rRNA (adenine1518-N6/adenine1519-N6)-dimethyltransferase
MAHARKRFGQHFLHDPAVLERIVGAVSPGPDEHLIEIGPGRGALTRGLLRRPIASLDVLEIDRDLAAALAAELAGDARVVVHSVDALAFDLGALAAQRGSRLRLVGNLPYNISTPLLFHSLASAHALSDLHVMLQREVVARITAQPGTSEYGRLTIMLAPWVRSERLFDIGPGAFQPPPRVWSSVLRMTMRHEPAFPLPPRFAAIVSTAFAHRRKTLRNALRGLRTAEQIAACGLDPSARPETLSPQAFAALAACDTERAGRTEVAQ